MTNNAIDNGIERLKLLQLGNSTIPLDTNNMINVLEAMKEPEEDGECKYCYNLKPGKWIPVDSIKKPRCSACGKKLYQDKPDPIHEVYDKYGKLSVHDMSHDGLVNAFINMRNAITQHCEDK